MVLIILYLGSEHGSCSALKVRGSATLATLSCHSWGCFELLPWGHGSEMKGILHVAGSGLHSWAEVIGFLSAFLFCSFYVGEPYLTSEHL